MSTPELVLVGGTVVTVDAAGSTAQAVAVTDGKISAVGTNEEIRALAGPDTDVLDLDGKTVTPGFIDPHSHVTAGAPYIKHAALHTPPVGDTRTVDDIMRKLREAKERNNTQPGEWILGWGYYPDEMDDGGGITAEIIDSEFSEYRVALVHISNHGGVANGLVLKDLGYDDTTEDPDGGTIIRIPGTQKPTGEVWEQAFFPLMFSLPPFGEAELRAMMDEYARWGYVAAQDGAADWKAVKAVRESAEANPLPIDVKTLVFFPDLQTAIDDGIIGTEVSGHTVQGTKLILDGSPQGRTANVSEEYLTGGPSGETHWHGIAVVDQEETNKVVELAYRNSVQVYAHCNGDAAITQLLEAHRAAKAAGATPPGRTIPIHSQVMKQEQLDEYVAEGFEPSMFTIHTWLFGDTHVKNFGEKRAFGISPMRSAIDKGLHPTNHSDFPVTPLNPLQLIWTAVERRSTGGVVIGADERVTPLEALRALTINAAYEYHEEDSRGSIEVGKRADFAVLDANPLTVETAAIQSISVLRTIKDGTTIYTA
ncbi:amidohydrolase [Demequina sediminicola]|uniref:amidohydrolase n=1 Tax=Demequina sediminicola TaxID=1095026 RepID=UPI00078243D4|nr:amidohydrolase [Demequina sediminicola]